MKDIFILTAMTALLGDPYYVFTDFENILSQIVLLFAATIILPMVINTMLFLKNPARSLGLTERRYTTFQNIVLSLLVIILSPLLPATILLRKRRCRRAIEDCERDSFSVIETIVDKENEVSTKKTERDDMTGEEAEASREAINAKIAGLNSEITELETRLGTFMETVKEHEDANGKLRELITECKATENCFETNIQLILQMSFLLQNQTGNKESL